jgi:hypothetical protein
MCQITNLIFDIMLKVLPLFVFKVTAVLTNTVEDRLSGMSRT